MLQVRVPFALPGAGGEMENEICPPIDLVVIER